MCWSRNYPACKSNLLWAIQCSSMAWLALLYFPYLSDKLRESPKKKCTWHEMCILIFTVNFLLGGRIHRGIINVSSLHVTILHILQFSWQILMKVPNTKFHRNPSSGSRAVPCRQTWRLNFVPLHHITEGTVNIEISP
jgi:hypothetical protein